MKKLNFATALLGLLAVQAQANFVPGRMNVVANCVSGLAGNGYQVTVTQIEGTPSSYRARVSARTSGGSLAIDEFELTGPEYFADGVRYLDAATQGKDFSLYADSSGKRKSRFEMDSKAGRIGGALHCSFPVHIMRADF
jgi:hypothetical protein